MQRELRSLNQLILKSGIILVYPSRPNLITKVLKSGRGNRRTESQRWEHTMRTLKMGVGGLEPGNADGLKTGKDKETDSTLRPSERKAAWYPLILASETICLLNAELSYNNFVLMC